MSRFANDFGERGLVEIFTISALSDDQTKTELKVEKFEEAYQRAIQEGKKVRAITVRKAVAIKLHAQNSLRFITVT